ncbi:SMI1/KNR4 family protein [Dactylosporangium sp. NPDC050688]|uniref:SMI1/KNR4 family protein n=1 Tax=Dactylosporangium sp. NPDC050688 TaxID=3157217 RepID=UPI0033F2DDF7
MEVQDRLAGIAPAIARRRRRGLDAEAVTVEDLDAVEARFGVPLPAEYRAFMLAFGTGVGPGYEDLIAPWHLPGVNRPDHAMDTFAHVRRPFTIVGGTCAGMYEHEDESDQLVDGALIIAEHGCTSCTIMAVTGDLAGTVWDNDWSNHRGPHEYIWLPARDGFSIPPRELGGLPVTFLAWVETWAGGSTTGNVPAPRPRLLDRLRRLKASR